MAPSVCPNCGSPVPPKARACPECGSDAETGWSEATARSGLDLPDEEFDYHEFVKEEFGTATPRPRGIAWVWWAVAILVLVVLVVLALPR